jgi:hypothetical protein
MSGVFLRKLLRLTLTILMVAVTVVYLFVAPNEFAGAMPTVSESLRFLTKALVLIAAWFFVVATWKIDIKPADDAE